MSGITGSYLDIPLKKLYLKVMKLWNIKEKQ